MGVILDHDRVRSRPARTNFRVSGSASVLAVTTVQLMPCARVAGRRLVGMRVLFASLASVGHTYPLIPLAIAARDAGHEVHFAAGENVHAPLAANGLRPFRPADSFHDMYAEDLEPELARLQPDLVIHGWGTGGGDRRASRRHSWHLARLWPHVP